jgi:hypothetical protein
VVQFQVKKAFDRVERIQSVYPCQACQSIQYKEHHQFEFELVFSMGQDNNNRFILFVNGLEMIQHIIWIKLKHSLF